MRWVSNIVIPLRDGVQTRADLWEPELDAAGPVILIRTPYGKEGAAPSMLVDPRLATARGLRVVAQDVRGKGCSDGVYTAPHEAEGADGFDTVQWLVEQPWCDGRVVMAGASHVGGTQWLAAGEGPPGLRGIAPVFATDDFGRRWAFDGDVRRLAMLTGVAVLWGTEAPSLLDRTPDLIGNPDVLSEAVPWCSRWFTEPADAPYWREHRPSAADSEHAAMTPALCVGGWHDLYVNVGTLRTFQASEHPSSRLIIGPWAHDVTFSNFVNHRNFGFAGSGRHFGITSKILDFYEAVIDGREPDLPRVAVFVLGSRRWVELDDWPPPHSTTREISLDGTATIKVDTNDLPPTCGGRILIPQTPGGGQGPQDQRLISERSDVAVLRAEPVSQGVTLAGPAITRLNTAATGGTHRDWAVTLCLEQPDGLWDNITEGIARCPTDADTVEVPLGDVCYELPAGARLLVLVAGGSVPRWEPLPTPGEQTIRTGCSLEVTTAEL